MENLKISIFEYMDVRQFLFDVYQIRKASVPRFSYSIWAEELGFSNKTLLRLILSGKRQITKGSREQFVTNLRLTAKESEYFDVLVEFSQSKTTQQRQDFGRKLIQIQKRNLLEQQTPIGTEILQDAYGPLVLMAISCSENPIEKESLQTMFSLPEDRVGHLLEILIKNELIEKKQNGYQARQSLFKVADQFGHQGLRNYYNYWLQKSIEAIDLPKETRRFRSLHIALTPEEFQEVNEAFNDFASNLLTQLEKNTLHQRRLYLMNNSLFPVTAETTTSGQIVSK